VTEDAALSKITLINEQIGNPKFLPNNNFSSNWSGYEFAGNSGATLSIVNSRINWLVPTLKQPTEVANECRIDLGKEPCSTAIWPGLEDKLGAGDGHLVQTGTNSNMTCTSSGCTTTNQVWYEYLDPKTPAVFCGGMTFSTGDNVTAKVTNQYFNKGPANKYNTNVMDNTIGQACGTIGQVYNSMTKPGFGVFIVERAADIHNGKFETIANFSPINFAEGVISINYTSGIQSKNLIYPYSNGWYEKSTMSNGQGNNTSVTAVPMCGQFTVKYLTSAGTT
jgi:hypothetical protein